jgi:hypothetical protein
MHLQVNKTFLLGLLKSPKKYISIFIGLSEGGGGVDTKNVLKCPRQTSVFQIFGITWYASNTG